MTGRRSAPAAWLACLLFAVPLLSGCAGNDAPGKAAELAGTTESRVVEGDEAPVAGAGSIRGRVVDDVGLPVYEATVALLGTALSAVTDNTGSFGFANVTPGRLTLRVDSGSAYRVHEGQVDVEADRVTEVTVTVVPRDDRGAGYRPHLHDYWGLDSEVTLLDRDYDLPKMHTWGQSFGAAGEVAAGIYSTNAGTWWTFRPHDERSDSRPPIVLPGTGELRITITWDEADVDVDAFVIGYQTAATLKYVDEPGQPNGATTVVPILAGEADNGHQAFSLWQFRVRPEARPTPMTMLGPIHVNIVMVKGDLPVDPPHEDRWNGTTSLVVRNFDNVHTIGTTGITSCAETYNILALDEGLIVPPGANRMTVRFQWASTRAPGTPDDGKYELSWKPANLPPDSPEADYLKAPPTTAGATSLAFDFPLDAGQTDAFYQLKSNWLFNAQRVDVHGGVGTLCVTNTEQAHQYHLEVIVHKDPTLT